MLLSRKIRLLVLFLILGCTAGCDQTTKHIARSELRNVNSVALPGGFGELRLAHNPGSFLSLGATLPKPLRVGLLSVGLGIGLAGMLAYLVALNAHLSLLSFLGLALVWAGGASNLVDRLTQQGSVTDFIFLHIGPFHTGIFNVADVIIMAGAIVVAWDLWKRSHRSEQVNSMP